MEDELQDLHRVPAGLHASNADWQVSAGRVNEFRILTPENSGITDSPFYGDATNRKSLGEPEFVAFVSPNDPSRLQWPSMTYVVSHLPDSDDVRGVSATDDARLPNSSLAPDSIRGEFNDERFTLDATATTSGDAAIPTDSELSTSNPAIPPASAIDGGLVDLQKTRFGAEAIGADALPVVKRSAINPLAKRSTAEFDVLSTLRTSRNQDSAIETRDWLTPSLDSADARGASTVMSVDAYFQVGGELPSSSNGWIHEAKVVADNLVEKPGQQTTVVDDLFAINSSRVHGESVNSSHWLTLRSDRAAVAEQPEQGKTVELKADLESQQKPSTWHSVMSRTKVPNGLASSDAGQREFTEVDDVVSSVDSQSPEGTIARSDSVTRRGEDKALSARVARIGGTMLKADADRELDRSEIQVASEPATGRVAISEAVGRSRNQTAGFVFGDSPATVTDEALTIDEAQDEGLPTESECDAHKVTRTSTQLQFPFRQDREGVSSLRTRSSQELDASPPSTRAADSGTSVEMYERPDVVDEQPDAEWHSTNDDIGSGDWPLFTLSDIPVVGILFGVMGALTLAFDPRLTTCEWKCKIRHISR